MPATKATPFRFTPDELAAMDDLAQRRGYKSRVALLRVLVSEEQTRLTALVPSSGDAGWEPAPATRAAMARSQTSGGGPYMTVAECPHPIGRRIGKACSQCGKDPA